MAKKTSLIEKIGAGRIWVQMSFLLIWLDPLALRMHNICGTVFHCYACPLATFACPIGVMAHFSALHIFPFLALGTLIVFGAVLGGFICGWACPFGLLQDFAAKVPTPKFELPLWTGYFRYVVLILLVLAIPYFYGADHPLFICSVCPAAALEASVPNMVAQAVAGDPIIWPNGLKLTILVLFLVTIFFVYRPWCRILCPLGAIFGLFNRVSSFFLRFDPGGCNDCQLCNKLCRYGALPSTQHNSTLCIRCLKCTTCGPKALTLGSIFSSNNPPLEQNNPDD